ncbi:hypothetical protein HRE68_11885 [Enterococcus faecalis]|nr:hypothetical protein [Enterococcus faecalis]NSN15467.1 hypothetical protein [Enterococcus faecalis]
MFIYGRECGNAFGCTYFLQIRNVELTVTLIWKGDFFEYNEKEVKEIIDHIPGLTDTLKVAIHQYIEKTNQLFFLSYKEKVIMRD